MGVTAPALYRYFDSHEALVEALAADFYDELSDSMEAATAARAGAPGRPGPARGAPADGRVDRLPAWSVAHPAEFSLIFGTPDPRRRALRREQPGVHRRAALRARLRGPVPRAVGDRGRSPCRRSRSSTRACSPSSRTTGSALGIDLPLPVVYVFLSCWARIYGLVTMEVFGHLTFALGRRRAGVHHRAAPDRPAARPGRRARRPPLTCRPLISRRRSSRDVRSTRRVDRTSLESCRENEAGAVRGRCR